MSRNRIAVAAGVLAVFALVGGILIYAGLNQGANQVTFNLNVTSAKVMSPDNFTARQNDIVTINMTSDTEGEVHLHVYDIQFVTKPGQFVSHTFKADKTCTCDIEWESTSALLGQLIVSP